MEKKTVSIPPHYRKTQENSPTGGFPPPPPPFGNSPGGHPPLEGRGSLSLIQ